MSAAVFVAASHWMHQAAEKKRRKGQEGSLAGAGRKLAACIRFPMLSNDFLHFVASQVSTCSLKSDQLDSKIVLQTSP